ncbi:MAG: hypothetical protein J3K34DRAFT_393188 [Monoraphidium minutum]|nr:MAG: hypothetical protein J3K34DRAFT_393188 [Monoraphidium minutum]
MGSEYSQETGRGAPKAAGAAPGAAPRSRSTAAAAAPAKTRSTSSGGPTQKTQPKAAAGAEGRGGTAAAAATKAPHAASAASKAPQAKLQQQQQQEEPVRAAPAAPKNPTAKQQQQQQRQQQAQEPPRRPVTRAADKPPAGVICRQPTRAALDALRLPPETLLELSTWNVRGKGDARRTAAWFPDQPLRIANVSGSKDDKPDGGWAALWEKVTQSNMQIEWRCAHNGCGSPVGVLGAHVWVEGLQYRRIVGIVPLCSGHNNDKKFPFPTATPARRGVKVMLLNAHEMFEGADKAGTRCLPPARGAR